jgi:hypothetical protein
MNAAHHRYFPVLVGGVICGVCLGAPVAQAQVQCPADALVSTVEVAGFSCVLGDKTFSAFDLSGVPAEARVQFGMLGPLFAVTLSRDGAFFADGRTIFDYTITPTAPAHILTGTVGVDVSFPTVLTTVMMGGQLLAPIVNGGTEMIAFSPGLSSVVVDNTLTISGPAELNSVTNDFAQVSVGVLEMGWKEANALLAMGVGIVFLVARRKK